MLPQNGSSCTVRNANIESHKIRISSRAFFICFVIFTAALCGWTAAATTSTLEFYTPPVFSPLHIEDVGPRTESVDLDKFNRVRYVTPVESKAGTTGEASSPWNSLPGALARIKDAGPDNRYALLVAAGTYKINKLQLKPYVELYGGFDAKTWGRDIRKHRTILDGQLRGPLLYGADYARIDGFHIENGRSGEPGGAVLCRDSSPWLSNNIFTANRTESPATAKDKSVSARAIAGGAVACIGRHSQPLIEKNIFAFNSTADGEGGAVACMDGAKGRIQLCVFSDNIAGLYHEIRDGTSSGGAIACVRGSGLDLFSNMIINNLASDGSDGGGVYYSEAELGRVRRNIIAGNNAEGNGGGIMAGAQREISLWSNIIAENKASGSGGGVCFMTGTHAEMENCLVCENQAAEGGGITADSATVSIGNNTIFANHGQRGAGLLCTNTHGVSQIIQLLNSIVYQNEPGLNIFLDDRTTSMGMGYCNIGDRWLAPGVIMDNPALSDDALTGQVATMDYDTERFQTRMVLIAHQVVKTDKLAGRVARIGNKRSIIAHNTPLKDPGHEEVWVWGDMIGGGINRPPINFTVLPTYQPLGSSPCIDAGLNMGPDLDLYGNRRPQLGHTTLTTDIGAIEYVSPAPKINPLIPAAPASNAD